MQEEGSSGVTGDPSDPEAKQVLLLVQWCSPVRNSFQILRSRRHSLWQIYVRDESDSYSFALRPQ
ncbi:hypothetical protein FRX31_028451, partial [Thalictrum thalictroides]